MILSVFLAVSLSLFPTSGDTEVRNQQVTVHTVVPGDTLGNLAARYGTTVRALAGANGIQNVNLIHVGQRLVVTTAQNVPVEAQRAPSAGVGGVMGIMRRHFPEQPYKAQRVIECESGRVAHTNTGNGYYGAWQFDLQTWQSVGGVGLPSNASLDEQTRRARMLYDRRGWQPWPHCGLR